MAKLNFDQTSLTPLILTPLIPNSKVVKMIDISINALTESIEVIAVWTRAVGDHSFT